MERYGCSVKMHVQDERKSIMNENKHMMCPNNFSWKREEKKSLSNSV